LKKSSVLRRSFTVQFYLRIAILPYMMKAMNEDRSQKSSTVEKSARTAEDLSLPARPLQFVKGVGPSRALLLKRLGLETVQDLLLYFPSAYKNREVCTPLSSAREWVGREERTFLARLVDLRAKSTAGGKQKIEGLLEGTDGALLRVAWWSPYVAEKLRPNEWGYFAGKVVRGQRAGQAGGLELSNPEFVFVGDNQAVSPENHEFGRIIPIYNLRPKRKRADDEEAPEIKLRQSALRGIVWWACAQNAPGQLPDCLPPTMTQTRGFPSFSDALRWIHFPPSQKHLGLARTRLAYEELLIVALGAARQRLLSQIKGGAQSLPLTKTIRSRIDARLPFRLTAAQERALQEIAADLAKTAPMNRLLQGDVGCGKTAVAVAAMLTAVAHGKQTALLAPTEVLAAQHFRSISSLLQKSKVQIQLFHGGLSPALRQDALKKLALGEIHIAVGTHSLLEPSVRFKSLCLAVIDEQHKFGVEQRRALREKGTVPHVLVMTATPIPRTIALTLYGDLELSVIKELPPGRGPVVTRSLQEKDRVRAYNLIKSEAKAGHASFIVLPHIEEAAPSSAAPSSSALDSDNGRLWLEVKGVEAEYKRLKEALPELRLAMLHGRLASEEIERVALALRDNRLDAVVSTLVVEVGFDLPRATVMLIENAERFGLASLHQLRGRVGRGPAKSYCLFFGKAATETAKARLQAFANISDGFLLAEMDFKLRGFGSFFGTEQSGLPEFKAADLPKDLNLLVLAKEDSSNLLLSDPSLSMPCHFLLKSKLDNVLNKKESRISVG
jgi:ATP-dependent DNA helicase RecG